MSYGYNSYSRKRGRQDDFDGESSSPARSYRRYNQSDSPGYRGGRGGGRGGQSMQPVQLSGAQRFKNDFWRMGEPAHEANPNTSKFVDLTPNSLVRMANVIRDVCARPELGPSIVKEMFSVAAVELPHKLPQFATILALLALNPIQVEMTNGNNGNNAMAEENGQGPSHPSLPVKPNFQPGAQDQAYNESTQETSATGENKAEQSSTSTQINLAHTILAQLSNDLDETVGTKNWRNARYLLRLFALCATTPCPSTRRESVITILNELCRILGEENVKLGVKDTLAVIVAEAVTILAANRETPPDDLDAVKDVLNTYSQERLTLVGRAERRLLYGQTHQDPVAQVLDIALLANPGTLPFVDHSPSITEFSKATATEQTGFDVPPLVVPTTSLAPLPHSPVQARVRLFNDDTVPSASDADVSQSYWTRQIVFDLMDVNAQHRRECARILLELGNGTWLKSILFKPKLAPSTNGHTENGDAEMNGDARGTWILENIIVECLLTEMLASSQSQHKPTFYTSLLVELCKLSPSTVAPAMGKCVRKIYADLDAEKSEGETVRLNPQGLRLFAEWFSVHLSNFNFLWRWPEWQNDVDLPDTHPKKSLIQRVLDLETRLSYYDRIKATLPEAYPAAGIMAGDAPSVDFGFDDKDHPHYAVAQDILSLVRGKSSSDVVQEEVDKARSTLSSAGLSQTEAASLANEIVFKSILLVGSKSFSHFLNSIERYIALLKSATEQPEHRRQLLQTVAHFFNKREQFAFIVIDKLLRYRIVDPIDVAQWMFSSEATSTSSAQLHNPSSWTLLECAITLAEGRVKLLSERLATLQDLNADKMADDNDADNTAQPDAELLKLEKALHSLQRELNTVVSTVARDLHERASSVADDLTQAWWVLGWATELGCRFGTHLAENSGELTPLLDDSECGKIYAAAIMMAKAA